MTQPEYHGLHVAEIDIMGYTVQRSTSSCSFCLVLINSVLLNHLCVWILFSNASSHSCFTFFSTTQASGNQHTRVGLGRFVATAEVAFTSTHGYCLWSTRLPAHWNTYHPAWWHRFSPPYHHHYPAARTHRLKKGWLNGNNADWAPIKS